MNIKVEYPILVSFIKCFSYIILTGFFVFIAACDTDQSMREQKNSTNMKSKILILSEKTKASLHTLSNSKVLFAHHSVGQNILSGLDRVSKEVGSQLVIINVDNQSPDDRNMIAHSTGGKNKFPKSKVDSFVEEINHLDGGFRPQIAFLKLCYVDFNPELDVNDVFDYYKSEMGKLERENPDIKFVHLTVPLTTRSNGLKSKIKRLLGQKTWDDASNIKRAEYNNLVIENHPEDSVFDLAKIESTHFDGSRVSFKNDDKIYYSLAPEYSNDGGHLNKLGQRVMAIQMVDFLADKINRTK